MTEENFLVPQDMYLKSGIHIGTKFRTKYMAPFIYKTRPDGLSVLNLQKIDERIGTAANFLSQYDPKDIPKLEELISRDIGISYKLFKYINSAYFARACKVSSVREALVYLGEKEIRRFVSLIAMSRLAKGKPNELIRAACIRGKFCELLAVEAQENAAPSEMFTLGMLAVDPKGWTT